MAKTVPMPPPGFHDLSLDEKLDYVQSLWDQVSAKPDDIPVPDWHRQILDERLAADQANPQEERSWKPSAMACSNDCATAELANDAPGHNPAGSPT